MIEIFDISYDHIESIKNLWEKNRLYHENTSEYFKESYGSINFHERIKAFSMFNKDTLKITVAKNNDNCIGYCISTLVDGRGELQSLHVDESNRGNGIGRQLATKHIEWMKEMNCKSLE